MFDFFKKDKPPQTTEDPSKQVISAPEAAVTSTLETNTTAPVPSWAERLKEGLAKTRSQLGSQLTILLTGGVGVTATNALLEQIRGRVKRQNLSDTTQLKEALKLSLLELLTPLEKPLETVTKQPFIIMLTGVNGAGKTTTIGKLANLFQAQGKSVLIAAGDTFRAAAREQLQAWGERNNVHVVASEGGDPAAVIFDAVNSARAKGIDIVLADTAGRLPTQLNLMEEIRKVQRVIDKAIPGAPHEVLLVLDANTGQNAVTQVKAFDDALGVTGLVLSKLDGTAKGGVIAAIAQSRPIPIRYIGVGEGIGDLRPFKASEFIDALFE